MIAQSATVRVVATRPFRMPELDDQKAVVGSKIIKVGETVVVDRVLAGELISANKAVLADDAKAAPDLLRQAREKRA